MNQHKIERFDTLLAKQAEGSSGAIDAIRGLEIQFEDGCCLFNVYLEWRGAYSFSPGRQEALDPIRRLSSLVANSRNDDTLKLYETPDWKALVALRGPFECAIRYTCRDCHTEYIGFGQSGFDDRYPAICSSCGNVWMQSGYDETPLPNCPCGGSYRVSGCPSGAVHFSVNLIEARRAG